MEEGEERREREGGGKREKVRGRMQERSVLYECCFR
jgi:hypothetical protein